MYQWLHHITMVEGSQSQCGRTCCQHAHTSARGPPTTAEDGSEYIANYRRTQKNGNITEHRFAEKNAETVSRKQKAATKLMTCRRKIVVAM